MGNAIFLWITLTLLTGWGLVKQGGHQSHPAPPKVIIPVLCLADDKMTSGWKSALASRMSKPALDSVAALALPLSQEQKEWIHLIESKKAGWGLILDSLAIPFRNCIAPDTTILFMGNSGNDDGFTFGLNTVCLDLRALYNNYGPAAIPENSGRIDRIFAHEFTHLLHKQWAELNHFELRTFKDSILWECLYEGIGMYRSLSSKWLPADGVLPGITIKTLASLYPVFTDRLLAAASSPSPDEASKNSIVSNLSRGPVDKKWGAFTVAIWLALESKGDERKLAFWIDHHLASPISLAKKYLPATDKKRLEQWY
ncbi:MAG TPA: hypothetical protein PKM27_13430 [Saprospiraceae bacterium]|nr:hypothetical protein [Saprospiraceae bacterium]HNT19774.1 hypothetical protein [Saprospiraceae bacterium]